MVMHWNSSRTVRTTQHRTLGGTLYLLFRQKRQCQRHADLKFVAAHSNKTGHFLGKCRYLELQRAGQLKQGPLHANSPSFSFAFPKLKWRQACGSLLRGLGPETFRFGSFWSGVIFLSQKCCSSVYFLHQETGSGWHSAVQREEAKAVLLQLRLYYHLGGLCFILGKELFSFQTE